MQNENEPDLRQLFGELREREQNQAPPFRRFWHGSQESLQSGWVIRARLAAAGALMLVIATVAYFVERPTQERPAEPTVPVGRALRLEAAPSLSTWRAPTDFLLETPGAELLDSVPSLHSPLPLPHLDTIQTPGKGTSS